MKITRILALMLCAVSISLVLSCSKEETVRDKIVGKWVTTEVSFHYFEGDIQITNWKNKTTVPTQLELKEDGYFILSTAKNGTYTGKWSYGDHSNEGWALEGEIWFEYDYDVSPGYQYLELFNHREDALRLRVRVKVDAGAASELGYESVTYPEATFVMERW